MGDDRVVAELRGTDGGIAGHVYARPIDEGVLLKVVATDLPPGEHAIHVHETGQCEAPGFESAGGHFNPSNQDHGLADRSADGAHAGDLASLVVDDDGRAETFRVLPAIELDARGGQDSLLREGGTSVVVHARPDDNRTDPAGAAGPRIACGVFARAPLDS